MSTIAATTTSATETAAGSLIAPLVPYRTAPFGVHSEAGMLRTVVLDIRSASVGEGLAETLSAGGVRVLPLAGLLADVLAARSARRTMAARLVTLEASSPAAGRRITTVMLTAHAGDAARMVLQGIPATDRDRDPRSVDRARYLVPPLPASRSIRQPVVAVGSRPLTALVSGREGRRAVAVMSAIGRLHPVFASARPRRYRPDPELRRYDATIDGDDVQLAPDGSVIVGVGHRTTLHGARELALSVLGPVPRVVAVALPGGALDRLDRLIAILGDRTALVHPAALAEDVVAWELTGSGRPAEPRLAANEPRPFREVLPGLLEDRASLHLVPDSPGAHGPAHFLALEPGAVLTSAPVADPTLLLLERNGIGVTAIPEDRGHAARAGGVRRLVLPVQRDAVVTGSGPTAL